MLNVVHNFVGWVFRNSFALTALKPFASSTFFFKLIKKLILNSLCISLLMSEFNIEHKKNAAIFHMNIKFAIVKWHTLRPLIRFSGIHNPIKRTRPTTATEARAATKLCTQIHSIFYRKSFQQTLHLSKSAHFAMVLLYVVVFFCSALGIRSCVSFSSGCTMTALRTFCQWFFFASHSKQKQLWSVQREYSNCIAHKIMKWKLIIIPLQAFINCTIMYPFIMTYVKHSRRRRHCLRCRHHRNSLLSYHQRCIDGLVKLK